MTLDIALEYILDLLASGAEEMAGELWRANEPVARAASMHKEDANGRISTSEMDWRDEGIDMLAMTTEAVAAALTTLAANGELEKRESSTGSKKRVVSNAC